MVLTGALAGMAVGGTASVINQVATTGDFNVNRFVTDVIGSGISGALAATGLGLTEQILGNVAIGAGSALLYSGLSGEPITVESGVDSLISGVLGGIAGGAGAKFFKGALSLMELNKKTAYALSSLAQAIIRSIFVSSIYSNIKNALNVHYEK